MGLQLDHVYICVSKEEFEELKNDYISTYNAKYRVTHSNEGSWEGLYLYSDHGFYIEVLCEGHSCFRGQVGIAFTDPEEFLLFDKFQDNPLYKTDLVKNEDGSNWFEYLTVRTEGKFEFYSWWMKYSEKEKPKRFNTLGKHKIKAFIKVYIGVSKSGLLERQKYIDICPHEFIENGNLIELHESDYPWIRFDFV